MVGAKRGCMSMQDLRYTSFGGEDERERAEMQLSYKIILSKIRFPSKQTKDCHEDHTISSHFLVWFYQQNV